MVKGKGEGKGKKIKGSSTKDQGIWQRAKGQWPFLK